MAMVLTGRADRLALAVAMYREGTLYDTVRGVTGFDAPTLRAALTAAGVPMRGRHGHPWGVEPGLLTWEEICAPGPGEWSLDRCVERVERQNAEYAACPSGFGR